MREHEADAADFPRQRTFAQWLAQAATAGGSAEFSSLWAGQAAPLVRSLPAAELVATLARDTESVLARAASVTAGPLSARP